METTLEFTTMLMKMMRDKWKREEVLMNLFGVVYINNKKEKWWYNGEKKKKPVLNNTTKK